MAGHDDRDIHMLYVFEAHKPHLYRLVNMNDVRLEFVQGLQHGTALHKHDALIDAQWISNGFEAHHGQVLFGLRVWLTCVACGDDENLMPADCHPPWQVVLSRWQRRSPLGDRVE